MEKKKFFLVGLWYCTSHCTTYGENFFFCCKAYGRTYGTVPLTVPPMGKIFFFCCKAYGRTYGTVFLTVLHTGKFFFSLRPTVGATVLYGLRYFLRGKFFFSLWPTVRPMGKNFFFSKYVCINP
jgi:hypothetical protein